MHRFLTKKQNRQWLLKLTAIILFFAFLGWAVWWYFNYRIEKIAYPKNKTEKPG